MQNSSNLKDFIISVKNELIAAQQKREDSFYELKEVVLEVSFAFDSTAKGSAKLFVVDIGGEVKSSNIHKVTLKLDPIRSTDEQRFGVKSSRNLSPYIQATKPAFIKKTSGPTFIKGPLEGL